MWGRTDGKLKATRRSTERERWIFSPTKFEPLIDQRTFDRVQAAHPNHRVPISNALLLENLRGLLASVGRLSAPIMRRTPGVPHPSTYIRHFGSLRRAFELIGYRLPSREVEISEQFRRRRRLQKILIGQIESLFPGQIRVIFERNRPMFIAEDGVSTMPIKIAECYRTRAQKMLRWALRVPFADRHLTTLICLPDEAGDGFESFHILHGVDIGTRDNLAGADDPLLRRGQRLDSLADLCKLGNWVQPVGRIAENVLNGRGDVGKASRTKALLSKPVNNRMLSAKGKQMLIKSARRSHATIRASGRIPGEEARAALARKYEARRREWQSVADS